MFCKWVFVCSVGSMTVLWILLCSGGLGVLEVCVFWRSGCSEGMCVL